MRNTQKTPASAPARPELAGRIARSLGIAQMNLNEVDFDDFFVSENIIEKLSNLAFDAFGQATDKEKGAFISAFWVEKSMELVICADAGREIHLMRVPETQWKMKPRPHH